MVDEFQDAEPAADRPGGRLAGPWGSARLCTVGRRAAVHLPLPRGRRERVRGPTTRTMRSGTRRARSTWSLQKNFRGQRRRALAFVDRVVRAAPRVRRRLHLAQSCTRGALSTYRWPRGPRIDLVLAERPAGRGTGVGVDDAKAACARAIARRFAALRACGHAPGDMVVLLGKMSRAETYAQALRDEGFECPPSREGRCSPPPPRCAWWPGSWRRWRTRANTARAVRGAHRAAWCASRPTTCWSWRPSRTARTGELRRRDLDKGFATPGPGGGPGAAPAPGPRRAPARPRPARRAHLPALARRARRRRALALDGAARGPGRRGPGARCQRAQGRAPASSSWKASAAWAWRARRARSRPSWRRG